MPANIFLDRALASKAAFDLPCPKEQLTYSDLGGGPMTRRFMYGDKPLFALDDTHYVLDRDLSRQAGVSGCGRHASYTYSNGAWLGSSAVDGAQK